MQGVWVWSLVGELRSHMPCSTTKTKKNKSRNKGWGEEDAAVHEVSFVKDASQTAPLTASDDLVLQGVIAMFLKPIDIFYLWPWRCTLASKCITASSPTTSAVMMGGSQAQSWLQGQQECHLPTSPTISGCGRMVSFLFFVFRHLQMHQFWLWADRTEFVTVWAITRRGRRGGLTEPPGMRFPKRTLPGLQPLLGWGATCLLLQNPRLRSPRPEGSLRSY